MEGQGNSSRICRSINTKGAAASIVTKLEALPLTGENNLRLAVHQHHGYNVHVTWTIKFRYSFEPTVDRCLERWFDTPEECDMFRKEVRQHPIQGICSCVDSRYQPTLRKLLRRNKLQHCHLFPTLTAEDLDQPRWNRRRWSATKSLNVGVPCHPLNRCSTKNVNKLHFLLLSNTYIFHTNHPIYRRCPAGRSSLHTAPDIPDLGTYQPRTRRPLRSKFTNRERLTHFPSL